MSSALESVHTCAWIPVTSKSYQRRMMQEVWTLNKKCCTPTSTENWRIFPGEPWYSRHQNNLKANSKFLAQLQSSSSRLSASQAATSPRTPWSCLHSCVTTRLWKHIMANSHLRTIRIHFTLTNPKLLTRNQREVQIPFVIILWAFPGEVCRFLALVSITTYKLRKFPNLSQITALLEFQLKLSMALYGLILGISFVVLRLWKNLKLC